jgi:hypothetical protein
MAGRTLGSGTKEGFTGMCARVIFYEPVKKP